MRALAKARCWRSSWSPVPRTARDSALGDRHSARPSGLLVHAEMASRSTWSPASLSLVAGVLVDDAIVDSRIRRHMRWAKRYQASLEAAAEIGLAGVATTFSIVAVSCRSRLGRYHRQYSSLRHDHRHRRLISLAVARMITPMIAAYFLKAGQPSMRGLADGPLHGMLAGPLRHSGRRSGSCGGVHRPDLPFYTCLSLPAEHRRGHGFDLGRDAPGVT